MKILMFLIIFMRSSISVASYEVLSSSPIAPFALPQMNVTPHADYVSTAHPGAVFVIEAYFLGCPYCNDNAANVDDLVDAYPDEPLLQVLDVGVDRSDSDYATWISRHQPNHPVLKDSSRSLIHQLGTSGYPSSYVLDCHGVVQFSGTGEWDSRELQSIKTAIDRLLAQGCQN